MKIEMDKMRMRERDSLQKAKKEIQQKIEKIAYNETELESLRGYLVKPYFLLINK
jgi:hypothetical protein